MATGLPTAVFVELELTAGVWTNVITDVALGDSPIEIQVGRTDASSDSQPGTCTFLLDNSTGAYTPDNPLSTYYGQLVEGIRVRVRVTASATTSTRFLGRITAIEPDFPEIPSASRTRITAVDLLGDLANIELRSALTETIIADGAVNFFPLDDGDGATSARSAIAGSPIASLVPSSTGVAFGGRAGAHRGASVDSATVLSGSASSPVGADNTVSVWFTSTAAGAQVFLVQAIYGNGSSGTSTTNGFMSLSLSTTGRLLAYRALATGTVIFDGIAPLTGPLNDGGLHRVIYTEAYDPFFTTVQAAVYVDDNPTAVATGSYVISTNPNLYFRKLAIGGRANVVISNVSTMSMASPSIDIWSAWAHKQWAYGNGGGSLTRTLSQQLADLSSWCGITCAFTSTSNRPATAPDTAGKKALELLLAIARGEAGTVYVDYAGGTVVAVAQADSTPTSPTVTIDAAADAIGGPQLSRSNTGRYASVTASSPVASATVTDATLRAQIGNVSTQVDATLANAVDLEALASAVISRGRDTKLRLRHLVADLVTATNALYLSLFNLTPGRRTRYSNLPSTYFGVTYIDGYAEGWVERIGYDRYDLELDLSPADAPRVGVWDTSRWAFGDGVCTVTSGTAVGTTATGTIVLTWAAAVALSTVAGDYPLDLNWNGERVTITAAPAGGTSPRTLTITARGVAPTVARVHSAGEPIDVWDPLTWA